MSQPRRLAQTYPDQWPLHRPNVLNSTEMPTDSQISSMADVKNSSKRLPRPVSVAGQPELKPMVASARPKPPHSRQSRPSAGLTARPAAAAQGRRAGSPLGWLLRPKSGRRTRNVAPPLAAKSRAQLKTVPQPHSRRRSQVKPIPANQGWPPHQRSSRAGSRSRRALSKVPAPLLYAIRLIVLGIGVAAIAGTLLSWLEPEAGSSTGDSAVVVDAQTAARTDSDLSPSAPSGQEPETLPLIQSDAPLQASIEEIATLTPGLVQEVFFVDLDNGQYVDIAGANPTPAASTIKLPILLAFFEEVDAGRITLNQTLALQASQIGGGSGDLQVLPPGTQFTALEVASAMIINSDNTATNMIIDLLGGAAALNARFKAQGLTATQIQNPLPDLDGTNTTSPKDLVQTLAVISEGKTLTTPSRDRVLNILQRTQSKGLIPTGVEVEGALTYNKTGDIALALGDAALVDLPNGKRYALSVLVQRPDNDGRARELIQRVSQQVFQAVNQPETPAAGTNAPTETTAPTEAFIDTEN